MVRIRHRKMASVDEREMNRAHHADQYRHALLLEAEDLKMIRAHIEESDTIEAIDPEIRAIVARNWPHLLSKLPPEVP